MSASLVGSEMCIRDRILLPTGRGAGALDALFAAVGRGGRVEAGDGEGGPGGGADPTLGEGA
eukprot:7003727-Alexandrium_andersonii.AAC.1